MSYSGTRFENVKDIDGLKIVVEKEIDGLKTDVDNLSDHIDKIASEKEKNIPGTDNEVDLSHAVIRNLVINK